MKHKMFLTLAALVLLFVQSAFAQSDFAPEVIWESKSPVTFISLKFSSDDRYFYANNVNPLGPDNGIHKFDGENGQYMGMFISGLIDDFGIIPEYGWMVCTRKEGLSIYDMNTGVFIRNIGDSWPGGWFDVSPDKSKIVFRQQGSMWVYSLPDLEEICRFPHNGSPRFLNNSQIAMTRSDVNMGGDNWAIDVYSVEEQKIIKTLPIPHPANSGDKMYVSPDYKNLITTNSSSVNFYDIETGELRNNISDVGPYYFGFNPTSKFYAVSDFNRNSFYNYENHTEVFRVKNDIFSLMVFLNLDNKKILSNKFGNLKMLRYDFDSLATGVEIKANIPVIYPNPTSGFVNIPLNCINSSKYEIFNTSGRLVNSIEITGATNNLLKIDFTIYPAGVYSVKVYCGKDVFNYQVVRVE